MEAIYQRPRDYDLEHEGDDEDIEFYCELVRHLRPQRVLELACGSGRVTIPLAKQAAALGFIVAGIDMSDSMLAEAERKRDSLDAEARQHVSFMKADVRTWVSEEPFDLIIAPCSSLSHLLTLEDQLAAWSTARRNLRPGGRLVADLTMPNLPVYAESLQTPPRTTVEIDLDTSDPATGERLVRYKTTRYLSHEQRAEIRFLYDKFQETGEPERYISDFTSHVYYPRELELLFRATGFEVESRYGDYRRRPLRATSRQLVFIGAAKGPGGTTDL